MALAHSPKIVTNGLVFAYDMGNAQKSWKGAPTFNASLQNGQNDVNPWFGDGSPTPLGIEPNIRFRKRKVAKFRTGTSGNCYINGAAKLSTGTNSTVWTSTFYLKRVDGTALSSVGMYLYVSNNSNVNQTVSVTQVEDGWYKAVYTRSGLVSGHPTLTGMFSLGVATEYYFADWQCENIGISTPWVFGTRSNTQAILDWTGNNTITANSLTYNADGTFEFNGTTDFLDTNQTFKFDQTGQFSVDFWINFISHSDRPSAAAGIVGKGHYYNNGWDIWLRNNHQIAFETSGDPTRQGLNYLDTASLALNTWHYYSATYNNGLKSNYVNGNLIGTQTYSGPGNFTNNNNVLIGRRFGDSSRSLRGSLSAVKIYNRALTAAEVAQNFSALRGRYGI